MADLKELVIKGPDPEKHRVVRWRCVDLCEEIARRYSVNVEKGTVGTKPEWGNRAGFPIFGRRSARGLRQYETIVMTWSICLARSARTAAWAPQ